MQLTLHVALAPPILPATPRGPELVALPGAAHSVLSRMACPFLLSRWYADYARTALQGPLLKQVWGDGDSQQMLSVWVNILQFLGDISLKPKQQGGTGAPESDDNVSNLEAVRRIISIGLTRKHTRDEIVCQICKQLTNNPSKASVARGWILLALCVSCFPPSEAVRPMLEAFIKEGPKTYRGFVAHRLQRSLARGARVNPITAVEMEAAFTKRSM